MLSHGKEVDAKRLNKYENRNNKASDKKICIQKNAPC